MLHAVDAGQESDVSQDEDDAQVDQEHAAVTLHVPAHTVRDHQCHGPHSA